MTRDFAYGEADPLIRRCVLLPWAPTDLLDLSSSTPEPPAEHYQVGPWPRHPGPVCPMASGMSSARSPNVTEPQLAAVGGREESGGVCETQVQSLASKHELHVAAPLGISSEPRPRGPNARNRPSRGWGGAGGGWWGAAPHMGSAVGATQLGCESWLGTVPSSHDTSFTGGVRTLYTLHAMFHGAQ